MSWIQVTETSKASPSATGVVYTLAVTVVASNSIDRELFVYSVSTGLFSHVATLADLDAYPQTLAEAQASGAFFYRQNSMSVNFTSKTLAAEASAQTHRRLALVNKDWGAVKGVTFGEGDTTVIYDSEEP